MFGVSGIRFCKEMEMVARIKGQVLVGMGLVFLTLCPFLLILKEEATAEKAAIWAYMFLVVGIGQEFIEYFKERK